jgi:hypothetical protein
MLDENSKGEEIVIDKAPAPKHGQVIDIMGSLEAQHGKSSSTKPAFVSASNCG